jgi:outer membrane protein assembly factor BamB
VNPRTGRTLWTITNPGFGTSGGPNPLLAQPDAVLTAGVATGGTDGNVAALRPDSGNGQQLWSSPPLPSPLFLAASGSTVYVTVCQPWPGSQPNLCAYQQLVAIAG